MGMLFTAMPVELLTNSEKATYEYSKESKEKESEKEDNRELEELKILKHSFRFGNYGIHSGSNYFVSCEIIRPQFISSPITPPPEFS